MKKKLKKEFDILICEDKKFEKMPSLSVNLQQKEEKKFIYTKKKFLSLKFFFSFNFIGQWRRLKKFKMLSFCFKEYLTEEKMKNFSQKSMYPLRIHST